MVSGNVPQHSLVTACLITWRRQHNLPKIIESLSKYPFISEIIVRDNSKAENLYCYGRYRSALKASNEIIYTQDDDCIIGNLDQIYNHYIEDPETICHSGIEDYEKVIKDNIFGNHQMAMFGWGAFFKKSWIPILDRYTNKWGKDYCFMRETDRIFSILKGGHHNFVLGDIEHMGRTDEHAMSNQPDHLEYKKLAIERALSC